tara:strand:- start:39001 stop:40608 length:1608 start_codon:yes stop_codon:yes gene_type:complete
VKLNKIIPILILPIFIFSQEKNKSFEEKINYYKSKFEINCVTEKATDNKGNGLEILYGTRNFRSILHGVAYRGGGNNYYHKKNKRGNKNPLPQDGLENLLEQDFSNIVYLYKTNWNTAPRFVEKGNKRLDYFQLSGNDKESRDSILLMVYEAINNNELGPIYLHCWNGWHQSGYISAVLLKQFCGFSTLQSLHYWEDCADSWSKGYDRIKDAIINFEPIEKYKIEKSKAELICPCYEDLRKDDTIKYVSQSMEVLDLNLPFPSGGFDLEPSVSTFLDEYGNMLKKRPEVTIEIQGHSDHVGDENKNKILSEKRAKKVHDYLIKIGVDSTKINYYGYGETQPIIYCDDKKNKCTKDEISKNRRVTFRVKSIECNINFEKERDNIPTKDKQWLNEIFDFLSSDKNIKIEIQGHADGGTGSDFVNQEISENRARKVYEYLKNKGFDVKNISWKGYGSKKQKYYDTRDRRIELNITYPKNNLNQTKKYHTIKKGDSLSKIALQYYNDYNEISKLIKLNKKILKNGEKSILIVGKKLRVR